MSRSNLAQMNYKLERRMEYIIYIGSLKHPIIALH
jgi:hypothetical protein